LTAKYWRPPPKAGDIVHCLFPADVVGTPGPKARPALVIAVEQAVDDPQGCVVEVTYATSQKTNVVFPGEFVLGASPKHGLSTNTKFDLGRTFRLPFDDAWFGAAPGSKPPYPRRGRLDLADSDVKRRLYAALAEARNARR
jgi:hypothetical protein